MAEVDRDLFRRAAAGDTDAFWRLISGFRGLIYSVAFATLRQREAAEDLLHEVMIAAHRALADLRDPGRLASWLYTMTRNRSLDQARREQRQARTLAEGATDLTRVVPIAEVLEKEVWLTRMEEAMNELPEPFRVVLAMKYMNDYSCREIAEITELTVPAVKSRLFEARKLLRKRMENLAAREKRMDHEMQ